MANLPLALGEIVGGGLLFMAGLSGHSLGDVISGHTSIQDLSLLPGGSSTPGGAPGTPGGSPTGAPVTATGTLGKVMTLARALTGSQYNQGGHATAINQTVAQVQQLGTDCSGYVSDLMGPQGLGIWHTSYATPGIPSAPGMVAGKGSQITLWNNANPGNAGHVWIQFDVAGTTRYFEDAGGIGAHEMSASEAQSYLSSGQYQPFHPNGY